MNHLILALALLAGCASKDGPTLHILTWANYFAKDTVANFEKEFRCAVKVDYMESSESLRTKLAGGTSGYDVVFPSDEVMAGLIAQGLLDSLDSAKLPNLKNIASKFRSLPFDPKNIHSVPYLWGTTAIAYHKEKIHPPPDSWAALWDPKWANRVTLLDDAREVFAAAVRLDGGDLQAPQAIEKAEKRFSGWKPLAYESSPRDLLINGDAWIAQCFSGDALQAADELPGKIGYVIPKEGGTLWIDNLCLAKGAPQPSLAHKFIDYLLRPEVSAAISNEMHFANPNEAAAKFINRKTLENRLANPGEDDLKRLQLLPGLTPGRKKALDDAWARVKGS
jgi:spermidine/putrescine-binding protein